MSRLEMVLILISVVESAITFWLWRKYTKAEARAIAIEAEYRASAEALGVWSNAL